MTAVIEMVIFLSLVLTVHADLDQLYNQNGQNYYDYGNLDDQSITYPNNDTQPRIPLSINWRWPFKPQNTVKVTRQPASSTNEEEDDSVPNDKFLFPDTAVKPLSSISTRFGAVPVCEGKTFCEEVPDYPSDFVKEVIRNNERLQNYENVDVIDNINLRIDTVSTESLCLSNEQIVYPKTAENMNKQWLFILNNANFTQGIRTETCMQEGQSCKLISGFAAGYITSCKQKYTYRRLTAISEDGGISRDLFRFPASCCCHVEFVGISSRMRNVRPVEPHRRLRDANAN